jgi:hypothetical protein
MATNVTDSTPARGYGDTITFNSTDGGLAMPSYAFIPADAGTHTFNVAMPDPGSYILKVTDPSSGLSRTTSLMVRIPISAGWNALDVPFQSSGIADDASLVTSLDGANGLNANATRAIATYANGAFSLYVPGYSPDRSVSSTQGIFVLASAAGTWLPSGTPYTASQSLSLASGWNLVAIPYPPGGLSTTDITREATGCNVQEIALYTNGSYQVWTPSGSGAPFTVPTWQGVWIECSGGGSITPSKPTR